jgi:hypothetical protein
MIMKKNKMIAGIIWAFLCLILIIILFPGLNSFSNAVSKLHFMKINPRYTGGEVRQQLISESCTLNIHRPVFDGLFGERHSGFVQLDWRGNIPEEIIDTIDFNFDKIPDFRIQLNPHKISTTLNPINNKVDGIIISTPASYGWSVRVGLKK